MSHHEPECEPASIDCDNRGYQRSNNQNLWMSLGGGCESRRTRPEDDLKVQWF
jgi:hypothetical protein